MAIVYLVKCVLVSGSAGSIVSVEAAALSNNGPILRQCILARLSEVTPSVYQRMAESGAAAMLVILPANMTAIAQPAKQLVREVGNDCN